MPVLTLKFFVRSAFAMTTVVKSGSGNLSIGPSSILQREAVHKALTSSGGRVVAASPGLRLECLQAESLPQC